MSRSEIEPDRPDGSRFDRIALVWLAGTWAGAWAGSVVGPQRFGLSATVLAVTTALIGLSPVINRRSLAAVPLAALALLLMVRAETRYQGGLVPGRIDQNAIVVSDPVPAGYGWRATLKLADGRRVEAVTFEPTIPLSRLEVGERVEVSGRLRPTIPERSWDHYRHVIGSLSVDRLEVVAPPPLWLGPPRWIRDRIEVGSRSLPRDLQPLYLGLVIGDDRFQSPAQKAQFRSVGLSHLLAVSGQNVAFVLAVVAPATRRFPISARLWFVLAVLGCFVVVTRAEPSVLRAVASAGVATWASVSGRERSGIQVLSVACVGLILVDPFLARVVGFQLSVGASLGILLVGPALVNRLKALRLPGVMAEPLAVTVAAQVGVGPLLVAYFGPLPVASLPANLAAGWAAGLVMTLGLTAGIVAGLTLPSVAVLVQLPVTVLVWWVDAVASWSARLPLPHLGPLSLITLVLLAMAAAWLPRRAMSRVVQIGIVVVLVGSVPRAPSSPTVLDSGISFWPGYRGRAPVVVVDNDASWPGLEAVLKIRLRGAVVVCRSGDHRSARFVNELVEVVDPELVLAPPQHRIKSASRVTEVERLVVDGGSLVVAPTADGHGLTIEFSSAAGSS